MLQSAYAKWSSVSHFSDFLILDQNTALLKYIQGVHFNWNQAKFYKYKYLFHLWRIEKFWASLHGTL